MTNYEIVKKLIGNVRPQGDASKDYQIFENLKELIELHSEIHSAIYDVANDFKDDKRSSVKKCCDEANTYLYRLCTTK